MQQNQAQQQLQTQFGAVLENLVTNDVIRESRDSNAQVQEQQRKKEFHKHLQSNKVKQACEFKCKAQLPHTQAQTVQEQLFVLEWYFNAIAFAEQSEIGEFDQQYLIEIIASKGFTSTMYNIYQNAINENGEILHFDNFGEWIFQRNYLTAELMELLCQKLVTVKMRGNDPPSSLLRHHKKWYTMICLAITVTHERLSQYVTSNEDMFIKCIFNDLPNTYKKILDPWCTQNGDIRPHSWDELQELVHLAWKKMIQKGNNYHPSKMNIQTSASDLVGKRILAMRNRSYGYQRGRGRSRGYRGYQRNRGYRGNRSRGRSRGR